MPQINKWMVCKRVCALTRDSTATNEQMCPPKVDSAMAANRWAHTTRFRSGARERNLLANGATLPPPTARGAPRASLKPQCKHAPESEHAQHGRRQRRMRRIAGRFEAFTRSSVNAANICIVAWRKHAPANMLRDVEASER